MDKLAQERGHLALADQHISEAEQRLAGLAALIARRRSNGVDASSALALLGLFEDIIATYRDHRQLILDSIARLERAGPT
ncbi:hypothetical protein [Burkholderia multivorans]|uniref:hypothetical protein n=1 Tax=Burkholderia multivorans TaxID=87883 RepID=UPI0020A1D6F8|nr:hypothetical protein [Burkholderia multivorans]MCO8590311.1 hypothetical protein [Burkholderia multivorans]MCO8632586.1 hypothetical protein [Burkholderia multivorans]MCO8647151.1 hypothetical protein [Burkholderia multivorans]